ncbi:hypothetical protein ACLEE6_16735 [Lonsdalea quercina]|uniref:hypothetical protein n=1 Tax=Lonsdalea quercina TaxID=71657 RepID=UPI003976BEE0
MIIRIGMRRVGVPSGSRWPREIVGWFRRPTNTVINHIGTASAIFIESCVVGVKVYGNNPSRFKDISNSVRASNMEAHLCPGRLIGSISCFVNILSIQACSVDIRFETSRLDEFRISRGGIIMAIRIRGTPRACGIIN